MAATDLLDREPWVSVHARVFSVAVCAVTSGDFLRHPYGLHEPRLRGGAINVAGANGRIWRDVKVALRASSIAMRWPSSSIIDCQHCIIRH